VKKAAEYQPVCIITEDDEISNNKQQINNSKAEKTYKKQNSSQPQINIIVFSFPI
jgi:hypothetical protein